MKILFELFMGSKSVGWERHMPEMIEKWQGVWGEGNIRIYHSRDWGKGEVEFKGKWIDVISHPGAYIEHDRKYWKGKKMNNQKCPFCGSPVIDMACLGGFGLICANPECSTAIDSDSMEVKNEILAEI